MGQQSESGEGSAAGLGTQATADNSRVCFPEHRQKQLHNRFAGERAVFTISADMEQTSQARWLIVQGQVISRKVGQMTMGLEKEISLGGSEKPLIYFDLILVSNADPVPVPQVAQRV